MPPAEWSPLVPPSSAVCLQGNRQGERAASTWLTNNWDQRLCSEGVVAASSEREGAWLDLSTAACWRGPGAPTPWPGVELPTAWSSVSAGNGWLSLPQPERPSRTLPPDRLRPQDVQKLPGRTCHSSPRVRGKPGLERERGRPLSGPDCPVPGRAAWKSPGLGGVGNGFLASQPNCSTFWTVSLCRSRSRPELGSFLEEGEASRANRHDSQPHSSPD